MKSVRIGAAEGFYGDSIDAAVDIARNGDVQYLSFDCLAELTMAILLKDKKKDPSKGYTQDVTVSMRALLPYVKEKGIKILTNAGGINPEGAQQEVIRVAQELGITGLKVAVVTGDNLIEQMDELQQQGVSFEHMTTGEKIDQVRDKLLFANAYLSARPIVEALKQGADIVVTGRTTDTAQFLAPLIYEFGWREDQWNELAQGILMGHLMECSAQSTGGNFSGNWHEVEGMDHMGYPIAEVQANGDFVLTKTETSGGLVSIDTVREQMLYEIHDPSAYVTPDVVANFTTSVLTEVGHNQVRITGTTGSPCPDTLKVVMGYQDGYMGQAVIGYAWPDALKKARKADAIIRHQLERKGWKYDEIRTDYVGYNSLHGPTVEEPKEELNEVYLRMAVRTQSYADAAKFRRLFPPLGLNGPPSLAGMLGSSSPRALMGMWSCLVPRRLVEERIDIRIVEV